MSSGGQGGGQSREDKVLDLAADVLRKVPDLIDYEQTAKILADDPSPLNVVLLQEVSNILKGFKDYLIQEDHDLNCISSNIR